MAIIAQITLTLHDDGGLQWQAAPIANKGLLYGLLECGRDEIKKAHEQLAAKAIQPATSGDLAHLPPLPNGNGRG